MSLAESVLAHMIPLTACHLALYAEIGGRYNLLQIKKTYMKQRERKDHDD